MALAASSLAALGASRVGGFDLGALIGGILSGVGNALSGSSAPQYPQPPAIPQVPQKNFDLSLFWWVPLVFIAGLFVYLFKK